MLVRRTLPVPSAHQVSVGALQGHRPRVAAQNPNNSCRQLFYSRDNGGHYWNHWFSPQNQTNTSEVLKKTGKTPSYQRNSSATRTDSALKYCLLPVYFPHFRFTSWWRKLQNKGLNIGEIAFPWTGLLLVPNYGPSSIS